MYYNQLLGIKKVQGGALEESLLVAGVAFKKTFSYAGFEMQPKTYKNCKIALLNIELELKAERDNAEIRVDNVKEYQKIVDAEWNILYNKLAKIHESGAQVNKMTPRNVCRNHDKSVCSRLCCQNCPSVMLQLSILRTETCSVLVAFRKTTFDAH